MYLCSMLRLMPAGCCPLSADPENPVDAQCERSAEMDQHQLRQEQQLMTGHDVLGMRGHSVTRTHLLRLSRAAQRRRRCCV